jgi:hypothetical protein
MKQLLLFLAIVVMSFAVVDGCSPSVYVTRSQFEVSELDNTAPSEEFGVLKVYLDNGYVTVLKKWHIDNDRQVISGRGYLYDNRRNMINSNYTSDISFDQATLLETNDFRGYNVISPMLMTLTIFTAAITTPCIGDPKACFGSCPTFYLHQDDSLIIQAEGFSSSITKSMEAEDIDFLRAYNRASLSDTVKIELMNEAYETHYIRRANLVAIPSLLNEEVYHDKKNFYTGSAVQPAKTAWNGKQNVADQLAKVDRKEYLAKTDSLDLTTKESLILNFDEFDGSSSGIVVTQRQSLLTTYLFYSSMAQIGSQLGTVMAAYENTAPMIRDAKDDMYDILGEVEVSVLVDDHWVEVGRIQEQGPIVTDSHLVPINIDGDYSQVKLTMTKGLWQIDQVGVVELYDIIEPQYIKPAQLLNEGIPDAQLLAALNNEEEFLVNNPGVSYTLVYELPDDQPYSIFMDTRGYYTEWMRAEWLAEENQRLARMIINRPKQWLKVMSPGYKQVESEMNELFWRSKFGYNE